jgi:hypothetical protein
MCKKSYRRCSQGYCADFECFDASAVDIVAHSIAKDLHDVLVFDKGAPDTAIKRKPRVSSRMPYCGSGAEPGARWISQGSINDPWSDLEPVYRSDPRSSAW